MDFGIIYIYFFYLKARFGLGMVCGEREKGLVFQSTGSLPQVVAVAWIGPAKYSERGATSPSVCKGPKSWDILYCLPRQANSKELDVVDSEDYNLCSYRMLVRYCND